MKQVLKITVLSGVVLAIVFFWMIPSTKAAEKVYYVRVYEIESDSGEAKTPVKVVKKDTIGANTRLEDLKVPMYSRGMHFKKVVPKEPVPEKKSSAKPVL